MALVCDAFYYGLTRSRYPSESALVEQYAYNIRTICHVMAIGKKSNIKKTFEINPNTDWQQKSAQEWNNTGQIHNIKEIYIEVALISAAI